MTILFIVSVTLIIVLRSSLKVYKNAHLSELARQAKKDKSANKIYKAAKYGVYIDVVVGILLALLIAAALVALKSISIAWFSIFSILVICFVYVWPKSYKSTAISNFLAAKLAPILGGLTRWISPVLSLLLPLTIRQPKPQLLYEPEDLISFLSGQKSISNSRISHTQINDLIEVLHKSDHLIKDLMIKRKKMKVLKPDEEVGPILLSELHDSDQPAFIVEDSDKGIVGTVRLETLSNFREGGLVERAMEKNLYFVNKDWSVKCVYEAYLETKGREFLVVDDTEKVVGIITLDQALEISIDLAESEKRRNFTDVSRVASSSK